MHLALDQFLLFAKLGQHPNPARRSGQRIKVIKRILQFALNGRGFQTHTLHRGHETLVIVDRDRYAIHG